MKYFFIFLLFINFSQATTLKEAFDSSRTNMETLKRSKAFENQASERKIRARALMLPTISGVGNETRIDEPDRSGVNQAFILTRQYSAALRLQQPIIRGGSVSGIQLANEDILLSKFQTEATELSLYQLVINSYYRLYIAETDRLNLLKLLELSKDRVKELKSRTSIGRSRKGELVQAEAQLLTAETQFQQGDINLIEARENFRFFTGLAPQNLAPLSPLPKQLPPLANLLEKVRSRPDVRMQRQNVQMASTRVEAAKGGHYPQLDLVGNYYIDRTGVLATSDWDVAVVVNIPLFQGGGVQAAVREQVEQKRVAELDSSQTLRAAERDLNILYQNFIQVQTQLETLKSAVSKAEQGYKLNRDDYNIGRTTNLDVIQSMNLFIETKRSYDNLVVMAHLTYRNLEASTGVLP